MIISETSLCPVNLSWLQNTHLLVRLWSPSFLFSFRLNSSGGLISLPSRSSVQLCNSRQATFLWGHECPLLFLGWDLQIQSHGQVLGCVLENQKRTFKNYIDFLWVLLLYRILFIRVTVATIRNESLNFSGLIQGSLFPGLMQGFLGSCPPLLLIEISSAFILSLCQPPGPCSVLLPASRQRKSM